MPTVVNNLTWYSAADGAQLRPRTHPSKKSMQLVVDAGTGDVQVQVPTSVADVWVTPADTDFTMSEDGAWEFARANGIPLQVIATGDAKFAFVDD
jgi:hypothetical protein